jgi:hypothetical protein
VPRYRVNARMWIADRIVEAGQIITVADPLPGADQAAHLTEIVDEAPVVTVPDLPPAA